MNLAKKKQLALLFASTALLLQGCGGSDDVVVSPPAPPPPPPPPTVSIAGTVLGGPLQAAKVCFDANDNRICDAGEPTATSAADGKFTLTVPQATASAHAVVAEAVAGTTIDTDTGVVARAFTLVAPAGHTAIVSPFTTLLQSEVDSGRAPNLEQAEETVLGFMVGTAGDTGGLTPYSNYLPDATDTSAQATRRARMLGLGQLLSRGFAATRASSGLGGINLMSAQGQVATGSLQQLLSQVTGQLTLANLDILAGALQDSMVPTAAHLADVAAAKAKTAAAPIEGAWVGSFANGSATARAVYIFAGDGTFVYQVIESGVAATSTQFDNGLAYRYGRYKLNGGTLTTSLIEAASSSGPADGALNNVTITGNTLTADGGITLARVTSTTKPLVGGWVRPNGVSQPEYLVMFDDGSYVHGSFYYQNDPKTGTASFFETAKSAGLRKGDYTVDAGNANVVNFGATSIAFNGNLTTPSNPGVAVIQPDSSLSLTGLRLVKLGTAAGAKAVTGFSEATRARLWSGRFFSRTVSISGSNRTQYVYVRSPSDVLTFLQAPVGSDNTVLCGSNPTVQGTALPDFTAISPADSKLKQFIVGTSTASSAGYAQRRFNIGQPGTGNFVTYTPITKPTNTTARCAWPL